MEQSSRHGFFTIGKIIGAHGIKGKLHIATDNESLSLFEKNIPILITNNGIDQYYTITHIKPIKDGAILSFKEVLTRDEALLLVGAELLQERSFFPKLEEGTYYWVDLIGMSVLNDTGDYVGIIASIFPTGSNDVYVIKNERKEILVPAISSVIKTVDLEKKEMKISLPEELVL
ncbi:MAG: 16S rRNA processing protein RimM [Desulfobacterales bacterium]|nr:16S rRNA processing protein RimM [Desulfobacterales bacterium]MBF0396715.1 16S rRNA processing protein RimM [Desulfobacterales bacterium]